MTLLKFGAPWCAPCKAMDKYIERVASEAGFNYESVDIDEQPERMPAGESSVPILMVVDSDTEVARHRGALSPSKLRGWLSSL